MTTKTHTHTEAEPLTCGMCGRIAAVITLDAIPWPYRSLVRDVLSAEREVAQQSTLWLAPVPLARCAACYGLEDERDA